MRVDATSSTIEVKARRVRPFEREVGGGSWSRRPVGGRGKPRTDCTDLTRLASVRIVRAIVRRVRRLFGREPGGVAGQIAEMRAVIDQMRGQIDTIDRIVQTLNHDIRSGADRSLPLFLGYAERLRLDADTATGVAQVIERRLVELEGRLDDLAKG